MNKLVKLAPIIVILACGGSLFFAFKIFKMKKDLQARNEDLNNSLTAANNNLKKTEGTLKDVRKTLSTTSNDLAEASKNLDDTKTALDHKTQEAEGLKTQVASRDKELQSVKVELNSKNQQVQKIMDALKLAGIANIENVAQIGENVQRLVEENKVLTTQLGKMRDDNQQLQDKIVELSTTPVNTRGRVANVQDRWGFLVLNIGEEQKVRKHSQFLIYRDSKPVGVVEVLSVGPTTSVAGILPEYQRGTPQVGDIAVH